MALINIKTRSGKFITCVKTSFSGGVEKKNALRTPSVTTALGLLSSNGLPFDVSGENLVRNVTLVLRS